MQSRRRLALVAVAFVLVGCTSSNPNPSPTASVSGEPTATLTAAPTATPVPTPATVSTPLALVTGYINLKADATLAELAGLHPRTICGITTELASGDCVAPDGVAATLKADPTAYLLVPPGLVTPTDKVLPIDGADLFGNPEARGKAYPLTGSATGLAPADTAYDAADIRTLMSLGDSCPDRGVAYQAITLGKGWEYVFGGGTAKYTAVYPNPARPGTVGNGYNIVDAVPTGNRGAVAKLVSGADITLDDFECPVVNNWRVHQGVVFSIDPRVLDHLKADYGVDVATMAANHGFDQGVSGFLETIQHFKDIGIPTAGVGADLDAALKPAIVDVHGLRFAFVGFNEVPGSQAAAPGVPGVAWLSDANVTAAVDRARATADIVFCVPQWWGGAEYHDDWRNDMRRQQAFFFQAGCDQVVGHGTHWSGPIDFTTDARGIHVTMVSHGNFLFGQSWSQQTQEGVTLELAFSGTRLVQARMHPYVMLEQAQTNLTDPETDGAYVLRRIFKASGLE
jgi:poly-gamma-glutamate capsule biosynthesis protein CapA/YwtB (metallophosphatase superfamily)